MSQVFRTEPDGTRVYANGVRYKPVPADERVYSTRKPDHPDAVRFGSDWYLPLELLPDEARRLPETRPDTDAYDHARRALPCHCEPCQRPQAAGWVRRYMRDKLAGKAGQATSGSSRGPSRAARSRR